MKLFEFCEADFIVANNLRDAVRCWITYSKCTIREGLEDFREIPRDKWKDYKFLYDEMALRRCTFEERIKEALESGEEKIPFFLATSEF